ncbi:MAG: signal recognition particle-docking protein FtsY [bacterium]|jgi:fused signal recognition particle receptor|nr:signal recognition particle-docking protein FtsY [candidate division KSB1 bacterium]MDH7559595.1 signal recognition particle-docking protein FtsY [bacterium]
MSGVIGRLRSGLLKSRLALSDGLARVVGTKRPLDSEFLAELAEVLIAADVGVAATEKLEAQLQEALRTLPTSDSQRVIKLLQEQLVMLLDGGSSDAPAPAHRPHVILVVGVNGTGKTTSIGKLAFYYRQQGKRVLLAAADTFRAAATEQLAIWAQRAGADMVRTNPGADPAALAFDALNAAMARGVDVLLVDTAGRLHTKVNLMEEVRKIRRVLDRRLPGAPHEVLLVIDATTGQNGLSQAREFTQATGVTGIVLTKLDGTAKGGIAVGIRQELAVPVRWVGLGEGISDLAPFDAREFVEGLFG